MLGKIYKAFNWLGSSGNKALNWIGSNKKTIASVARFIGKHGLAIGAGVAGINPALGGVIAGVSGAANYIADNIEEKYKQGREAMKSYDKVNTEIQKTKKR